MSLIAAAYVRMSTDQQDLSIGTQLDAIEAYAQENELDVARIYKDAGRSGLAISKREGMKQMLRDVMEDPRPFDVILVYDVSRWGRFQDVDAAAYYEYTCKLHGARVVYVQEKFGADDDPMTALLKAMQRTMAAKYSRDLGVKTRAGQDRAVKLGFQMGGLPCIGLSRVAIDRDGNRRPLSRSQHKAMQSEHIVWVPGPQTEVDLVNRIFTIYAEPNTTIVGLARQLCDEGLTTAMGRSFTAYTVDQLLRNEAFAGNFVWGRDRHPKQPKHRKAPISRAENVIEPIVPADLWQQVQKKLWARRKRTWDKEDLLQRLREMVAEKPGLCALDLEAMGYPKSALEGAFGSVSRAFELAGRDRALVRAQHHLRRRDAMRVGKRMTRDICSLLESNSIACGIYPKSRLLLLGAGPKIRLQLVWPRTNRGAQQWKIFKARPPEADWILLAQMEITECAIRFVLLSADEYQNTNAWLTAEAPVGLISIADGEGLLREIRARLVLP
ncbi:recombinase family protein [Hydrogenophaga sp. BPS33]|uniref:recombinase family protein n=1 Tax=Hydrogenophaga sp. BPS33 TaxID=2651974 RepID=UPI001359AA83|nr:recombinase family protein [Hydrogenophaga sp. BPS33]